MNNRSQTQAAPAAPAARATRTWQNAGAAALLVLGSLQMVGDATGLTALKGIGAALAASPLPKVFSDVRGLETFASEFTLLATLPAGKEIELPITPELYRRLGGPYNRRNVYGAALSYAPRLPQPLWQAVFCHGLGPAGPLRRELGVPAGATHLRVRIATRTRGRTGTWVLEAPCAE
ncbi:MAG TPA: hypothetical protein VHG32_21955 [Thermoanaerobaculia bacterium]|nr:hypothetical protein [Thermoanaerobaculia bacterium]